MAGLDSYKTVGEISRGALTEVWSAREGVSDQPPAFAVKLLQPGLLAEGDVARAAVEEFLDAADLQRQVAESGAKCWAPVLAAGPSDGGAAYVTRLYARSLEPWVLGRVRLSCPALKAVVGCILQGLREFQQTAGRAQGNLKLSNVLVDGDSPREAPVCVLCDPAPSRRLTPQSAREDLRAVGEIIHHLVVHRPPAPGPVAWSSEWSRLGPGGRAWHRLCERLLDSSVGLDELDLDELQAEVARIRISRRTWYAAAAVLVLLLAGGGGFVYWYYTYGPSAPVPDPPPQWTPLCQSYSHWFLSLQRQLEPGDRRARWAADSGLAPIIAALEEARANRVELDPRKIVGTQMLPKDLAQTPPRQLPADCQSILFTRRGHDRSRAAWAVVMRIEQALAEWPARARGLELAKLYRQRGWTGHAAALQSLCDGLRPPSPRAVEMVEMLLALNSTTLPAIEDRWQTVQSAGDAFAHAAPEDPILAQFSAYVGRRLMEERASYGPPELEAWLARVDELAKLAGELQKGLAAAWPTLDKKWFLSHSEVHAAFARAGSADRQTYLNWLVEVQSPRFRLAADRNPYARPEVDQALQAAGTDLRALTDLERLYPQGRAGELARGLGALRDEVTTERALPYCDARQTAIEPWARDLLGRLADLHRQVREQTTELRKRPPEADPREPVRMAMAEIEKALRLRESRRTAFVPRIDAACSGVKDPLALEWIVAYRDHVLGRAGELTRTSAALRGLKTEIEKFAIDEDPRPGLRAELARARADIQELEQKLKDSLGPAKFLETVAAVEAGEFWKAPWSQVDQRLAVVDKADSARKELEAMQMSLAARRQAVGQVRGRSLSSGDSPALQAHWDRRRDELIGKVLDSGELTTQATACATLLEKLAAQFAGAQVAALEPAAQAGAVAKAKREAALQACLAGGDSAMAEAAEGRGEMVRAYAQWCSQVPELAGEFAQIAAALDEGCGLGEPLPTGKTPTELAKRWAAQAVAADFAAVLKPTTDRLEALKGLGALDQAALVAQAQRSDDLALALNAWRELGDKRFAQPWPRGRAGLEQESRIRERLTAHVAAVKRQARKEALTRELAQAGPPRWAAAFASVTPADVEWAYDQAQAWGVQPEAMDSLPAHARFNARLVSFARSQKAFQERLAKRTPEEQAAQLKTAAAEIAAFNETATGLGPAAGAPVKEYIERVDKVLGWTPKKEDVSKAGPSLAGWTPQKVDDRTLRFTWTSGERTHTLTFLLVEPVGADANAAYLCTTEVSVGLYRDVMAERGKSIRLDDLLSAGEAWVGPRAWRLDNAGLAANTSWQTPDPLLPNPVDPQRPPKPAQPDDQTPMQSLSPLAAMCLARLLACRLPTSAEWQAAHEQVGRLPPAGRPKPNLRDAAFVRQRDALKAYYADNPDAPRAWADLGIYWPDDTPDEQRVTGEKAPARPDAQDDGLLWFAPVGPAAAQEAVFHHLVGNVAEMVCEDARAWNQPPGAEVLEPTKQALTALARKQALAVIGGSALSAPALKDATAYPLADPPNDKDTRFSDVGFRLAFTAPTQPLDELVRRLVEQPPYLAPPP